MAYITNTEAKTYIGGIEGSRDDTFLTTLIAEVEAFIEGYCDRDFEASADSTRYFDVGRDTEGYYLWFDQDLASITTVTNGDADSTVVSSSEYTTIPRNETPYYGIKILVSAAKVWEYDEDYEGAISIAGKWGYSTTPPADIVLACKDIVKIIYRSRDSNADTAILAAGMVITPNQIPKTTKQTLDRYKRL